MRFPEFMRKYLPILVAIDLGLALLVGYYVPDVDVLKVAIPFLLFVMLYPMMINLKVESIGKAFTSPKLLIAALLMNFLITPLLGFAWAHLFFRHADPYLSTGFILKVVVPCSGMVAAWTGYARGKVESALVIVALSLILAIGFVPLWMWVLAGTYVHIDALMMFEKMGLIVVLPLAAGLITRKVFVRKYGMKRFGGIAPYFPSISTCGMISMVFIIISTKADIIVHNWHWVLLVLAAIATLYPLLFVLAVLFSKLARIPHGDCMALGYSITARNHAITIGIATTAFSGTLAVLPAAVAPLIQIPIMMIALRLTDRIEMFLHPEKRIRACDVPVE